MRIEADLDLIDHFKYDRCGNTTVAILSHGENTVNIPLCSKCLSELRDSIRKYDNTVFCHQCNNFVMSDSGWEYGGTCLNKLSEEERNNFNKKDAGYIYRVDCLDTCKDAYKKRVTYWN